MLRGLFEFVGSTLYLWALNIALHNQVNQGICSAMITMAGLMITILSWIVYKEKLNLPQGFGITMILAAVLMMGFYQEQPESDGEVHLETMQPITKIMVIGFFSALSFSLEAILIKWLAVRGVPGAPGGQMTLLFDGLYGVTMLLVFWLSTDKLSAFSTS